MYVDVGTTHFSEERPVCHIHFWVCEPSKVFINQKVSFCPRVMFR